MGGVDDVAAHASAARVCIVVEAVTRGQVAQEGTNPHGWVREHAPSLRQGGAAAVARVALGIHVDRWTRAPLVRADPLAAPCD